MVSNGGQGSTPEVRRRPRLYWLAGTAIVVTLLTVATTVARRDPGKATTVGPAIGNTAPSFQLVDAVSGQQLSSDSLRGHKTLLFFSEGPMCQACMQQIVDLQSSGALSRNKIQLMSVAVDGPEDLKSATQQYGVTTSFLADADGTMSTAYGMIAHGGMAMPGMDGHAFMLIGPDGKVLWHHAITTMYIAPKQLMQTMGMAMSPSGMMGNG